MQDANCNSPSNPGLQKWNGAMEVAMTDLECIKNFYDIVKVGSIHFKGIGKGSMGKKDQWRWRCSHQKAYSLAKLFLPYSVSKRHKLLAIINHHEFVLPKRRLREKFNF